SRGPVANAPRPPVILLARLRTPGVRYNCWGPAMAFHPDGMTDRGQETMLRILGSRKQLCGGWTRREMLQAGALGLFGLGLSDYFCLAAAQTAPAAAPRTFGRAKACILLYLYG